MALLGLAAIIGVIAWIAIGAGAKPELPSIVATPTAEPTPTGVTAEDLAPGPGETSAPATTAPAAGQPPVTPRCSAPAVTVTAHVDAQSYAPGVQPQLSLTLANAGQTPCVLDVGTAKQVYTITSGSDTIWVSTHCQTEPISQLATLAPGQSLTAPAISWVRERSSTDTCQGERPAAVGGGATYQLVATVDGIASAPVAFTLD
ncbi:hypothetical protein USB125703_00519 [Pseudoclavibacter triregionum]|nr:hypothetical protein USB125703_00519 [Pseudoclavibacter triregionum]